jgi:anti-repressor protein
MTTLQIVGSREILGKAVIAFGTLEHPLFPAKEVAEWIEHRDISSMLRSVDENEKVRIDGDMPDPAQLAESGNLRTSRWYLTEEGLYEVLMLSRKPAAKEFKNGVKKMLHDIRMGKLGVTRSLEEFLTNPETILKIATNWKIDRDKLLVAETKIKFDRPKVEFANAVGECCNGKGLREFAIALKQNGIVRNEHEFIVWLLQRKYLYRTQKGTLMPYAQYVKEAGYFWLKTVVTEDRFGEKKERLQVKITGKGQEYLQQRLMKERSKTLSLEAEDDVPPLEEE